MGLVDDAKDKMHETKGEMKGRMESTDMDDKAKLEAERMRREHAENQNDKTDTMAP